MGVSWGSVVHIKNLILHVIHFMIYSAKKIYFEINIFTTHMRNDWKRLGGVIKQLLNSVLSVHRLHIYEKFRVHSSYGVLEELFENDRQTDRWTDI